VDRGLGVGAIVGTRDVEAACLGRLHVGELMECRHTLLDTMHVCVCDTLTYTHTHTQTQTLMKSNMACVSLGPWYA
jgi:hypothetical protein